MHKLYACLGPGKCMKPRLARQQLDQPCKPHLTLEQTFMLNNVCSIADFSLFGYVHVLEEAGLSLATHSAIARWIDAVAATKGLKPLNDFGATAVKAA